MTACYSRYRTLWAAFGIKKRVPLGTPLNFSLLLKLLNELSVLQVLSALLSSLEHSVVGLLLCSSITTLCAQLTRSLDLNYEILVTVLVELLEDTLKVDLTALADNELVLDVEHLDAVSILLQVLNGILLTHSAPVNVQLEEYVVGVGVLNQVLPHNLIGTLQSLVLL